MSTLIYPTLQQPVPLFGNETGNEARWYQPLSEPYRTLRPAQAAVASMPAYFYDYFPRSSPENIYPDKYWQPFSNPKWYPPALLAALQQPLAYSESAQFPEVVYIDKYLYPFSEPVRFPKALLVGDQPFFSAEPEPEEIDMMPWFRPFSEPKRFPKRLEAGLNPAFTTGAHALGTPYARAYVIC